MSTISSLKVPNNPVLTNCTQNFNNSRKIRKISRGWANFCVTDHAFFVNHKSGSFAYTLHVKRREGFVQYTECFRRLFIKITQQWKIQVLFRFVFSKGEQ